MPDGTPQFDLSSVGQDPGFRNATVADKTAFLSAHDADFRAATPADQGAYISHLMGFDKPTQFEQQRDPANQPGILSTAGSWLARQVPHSLADYGKAIAGPLVPGLSALQSNAGAAQGTAGALDRGQSVPYSVAAGLGSGVGVDAQKMEQAADVGNARGVIGEGTVPASMALAGPLLERGIGAVAPKAAEALQSSAAKNYEDVLNPTRIDTKYQTQKIMPQLMEERPVAMTRQGLADKAAGQADIAGQQIEDTVSNLQGSMKTQPVIDGLENLRQKYQVNGVSLRPEVDGAINTLQDQLRGISQPADVPGGAQGPGEASISYQDVVKARRILDQAVAEVGGYQGRPLSDTSMANIRKATANSFREELGNASPDLAAVNAKFHFWNTLGDVLDATIQRKTGQVNAFPKMETVIAGAGGLAKSGLAGATGYGAAINVLGKAIRSTGWRTLSAATKGSIADSLASGQFGNVANVLTKAGIFGAGQNQEQQDQDTTPAKATPQVPIASLLDYDPVQARQALANPITQHLVNALDPNVADAAIKKFGVIDTRKYFRGRNA
jgi:hypothetical protein